MIHPAGAQKVSSVKITAGNANLYRDSLKRIVFGTTVFPYDILPDQIVTNVSTLSHYPVFPYSTILYPAGNLQSVDEFQIQPSPNVIDFPEPVTAHVFHPHTNNGKLFIYHSGHCTGTAVAEDITANNGGELPGLIIPALIEQGYTVLAVPMLNYQFLYPNGYSCGYNNHDPLFGDGHYSNPLSLFFKPLIASLNSLGRSNYSAIYMCGLSGGGWTTSIYPAMDSSISCSFPVAGSWPLALRSFFALDGDYEQVYPPLLRDVLDYHQLYTLSCLAPARKMLQINNRYDACCFNGSTAQVYYVDSVAKALRGTGGVFKFYLDETEAAHTFSERALEVMLTFINNDTAFLQNLPADSITNGQNYLYDVKNNFALNTTPDNSILRYSLLTAPNWLSLNSATGQLTGIVPPGNIISSPDTISFKVEDSTGRFVLYNYRLIRKRAAPYFFTGADNDSVIYFLPPYRNSISNINSQVAGSIYFNNPLLSIEDISLKNNSIIRLKMNRTVLSTDMIGYNGSSSAYALTYDNGLKLEDFGLNPIQVNVIVSNPALAGMIRFNSETNKFEYFNGTAWINMN